MKYLAFTFTLLLLSSSAFAQDYVPPSKDLWVAMVQALQNLPMSANGHQTLAQILSNVQQQAKEQSNAQQKQGPSQLDGGSSPQPKVREEGRGADQGGEGVQSGGPSQAKGK